MGRGVASPRHNPLPGTLVVLHGPGHDHPWVLLTDTPPDRTEATLYACRDWIKQGFRGLKRAGWQWQRTRRTDPVRAGRHWLVLAVATTLGVHRSTVQLWLKWYREGDLDPICARRRGGIGKPSYLTPVQQEALVAEAAHGVFATAQAVRDWIEDQFGVVYTVGSMYTLLPRLGIRIKTPRPRHPKADPQAQAA